MAKSLQSMLNNRNTNLLALGFILGYLAEIIFLPHVGAVKYLFALPLAGGAIILFFNKEYPIQPGRFFIALLLCLIGVISLLIINSAWFSRVIIS
jgi:hypothetical protein